MSDKQLIKHKILFTDRSSFSRLTNNHPEFLPESEVLWILKNYLDKHKIIDKPCQMLIGTKYISYLKSIKESIKKIYPDSEFNFINKNDEQLLIGCKV
jgi:hypothetical protein